jgi:hypothetical protein
MSEVSNMMSSVYIDLEKSGTAMRRAMDRLKLLEYKTDDARDVNQQWVGRNWKHKNSVLVFMTL